MDTAPTILGLAGSTLLLVRGGVALAGRFPGEPGTRGARARWFAAGALLAAIAPVGALPIAGYVRGFMGDLSVTTLVLLGVGIASRLGTPKLLDGLRATWLFAVLGGAFLYPMALGLGPYDPYALGFAPRGLLTGVAVLAGMAWWRGMTLPLACLLAAVSAHTLDLMESHNLWDYILDPWLVLYSIYAIYELRPFRRKSQFVAPGRPGSTR